MVYIAYSGGLDSTVLLYLCHAWRAEFAIDLTAIHVNHRISLHADAWAKHCRATCASLQIEYIEHTVNLALNRSESLEEKARKARYDFFAKCLKPGDILLTAHQQDDQAETLLLQLLRGAGPKGLAAMPRIKSLGLGFHARPLLAYSRAELMRYAQEQDLVWIDDESNADTQLTRNFIRHSIMPLLQERWPAVTTTLSRSAEHCAEAQQLLEEFALELLAKVSGQVPGTLAVNKLRKLTVEQQRLVLRTWISQRGFILPGSRKLLAIQQNVLTAALDRMPCINWQGAELRRFKDNLYLMAPCDQQITPKEFMWDFNKPLVVPTVGTLCSLKRIGTRPVSLRYRQSGETVLLASRGKHALKKLLQEWHVPNWLRPRLPLVFVDGILICAGEYFVDERFELKLLELK